MEKNIIVYIRWRRWFFIQNRHREFEQFHARSTFESKHHVSYEWHFSTILFPKEKNRGSISRRWTRKEKIIHRYANEEMTMLNHSENSRFPFPSKHCPYFEHHRYILSKSLTGMWGRRKTMFTSIDHMRFECSRTIGNFLRVSKWFEKLNRNWLDFEKILHNTITSIIFSFSNAKLCSQFSFWKASSLKSWHRALYGDTSPSNLAEMKRYR